MDDMMTLKANTSKEAIALRTAAGQWFLHTPDPRDDHDTAGQRLNARLLNAAIAYAKRAENE